MTSPMPRVGQLAVIQVATADVPATARSLPVNVVTPVSVRNIADTFTSSATVGPPRGLNLPDSQPNWGTGSTSPTAGPKRT